MRTLNDLSKKYRSEKAALQKLLAQRGKLAEQQQKLQERERELRRGITNLKTLIDFCIETGESPVEAQLKNTPGEISEHMNQVSMDNYGGTDSIYLSQGLNITSSTLNSIAGGTWTMPSLTTSISPITGTITTSSSTFTNINNSNATKP